MRTPAEAPTVVLICHEGERLDRDGLASWLASTMKLAGLLIIRDRGGRRWRAVRRELRRVGPLGLLDVLAFRAFARVASAGRDRQWEHEQVSRLRSRYPADLSQVPTLTVSSPNSSEARTFLRRAQPDLTIARCKVLLDKEIYEIPRTGTFVLHPGICPEYRNAHGCFWALANRDLDRVGMTLLRVDNGVDTGPVYLHATCAYDERRDSHIVIQQRAVVDNLDAIGRTLTALARSEDVQPVNTEGRRSAVWGQPRLTDYLRWKLAARRTTLPIPDPRSPIPDPRAPVPATRYEAQH
jgi:folate-dependent phosphoribosylglycinamide formyltransferase PurN